MVEAHDPLEEQLRIAQQHEQQSNWEPAYKNFHEVARKALAQMANCHDANRKEKLK